MSLVMTSGPNVEPVTLAEAKAHLRVDTTAEDTLIASLVVTSRLHIEAAFGLALVTQHWSYFLDAWPQSREVLLPLRPVQAIEAVRIYASDTQYQILSLAAFTLDGQGLPPRVSYARTSPQPIPQRPMGGIEFAIRAGFGDTAAAVPGPLRQALLLLVAHWYEHRELQDIGHPDTRIPAAISDLLQPYRPVRL
jgi:uncharacterized phiE125 gp8 family phage protein